MNWKRIEIGIGEKKGNRNEVTVRKGREIWNEEGVWDKNWNEVWNRNGVWNGNGIWIGSLLNLVREEVQSPSRNR